MKISERSKSDGVSRRTILIGAAGALPLIALGATCARAKMAQNAVRYQDTPKDGKQWCGCNLFIAPNACKTVAGKIAPTGWCARWIKKA
jgi:hypothetical protein